MCAYIFFVLKSFTSYGHFPQFSWDKIWKVQTIGSIYDIIILMFIYFIVYCNLNILLWEMELCLWLQNWQAAQNKALTPTQVCAPTLRQKRKRLPYLEYGLINDRACMPLPVSCSSKRLQILWNPLLHLFFFLYSQNLLTNVIFPRCWL